MRADAPPGPESNQVDRLLWTLGVDTITEAARELGVPERTARYWHKTGRVPSDQMAVAAEKKGVPLDWLLTGRAASRVARGLPQGVAAPLMDTAWPALLVRNSVAAVRVAEEHAAVRLDGDQLADAVGIVVQMSAMSSAQPQQLAETVVGTMVASGQIKKRRGER